MSADAMCWVLQRLGLTKKKRLYPPASKILIARAAWWKAVKKPKLEKPVFIDEAGTHTSSFTASLLTSWVNCWSSTCPGNTDDRRPLEEMSKDHFGKLFANKGYLS